MIPSSRALIINPLPNHAVFDISWYYYSTHKWDTQIDQSNVKKKKKKDLVLASFAFDFLAQLKIFLMLCLDVMVGSREGIENVSRL